MKLDQIYLKIHSAVICYTPDSRNKPITIQPTIEALASLLEALKPTTVHCERPFATPSANPKIYYMFTLLGALKALCYSKGMQLRLYNIGDIREDLFGASHITKDYILQQTNIMWGTAHDPALLPVHELCMFDAYCIAKARP